MAIAHAAEEGIHITLKAEPLFEIAGFPITNTLVTSWIVLVLLIVGAFFVGRNLKKIPGKVQTFFETAFDGALTYFEEVLESQTLARRYFPLIVTLFLFILAGNWFGLLPGVHSLYVNTQVHSQETHVPLFHPISTDLNVTLALALISFLVIELSGIFIIGFLKYAHKFVNFKSPIGFFVGIIELFSEIARLVSFSFRLFGNMFAGATLILVVMFFVPYIVPVPLMLFEVFVGFIQAAIFSLLTLFFIKIAITDAH